MSHSFSGTRHTRTSFHSVARKGRTRRLEPLFSLLLVLAILMAPFDGASAAVAPAPQPPGRSGDAATTAARGQTQGAAGADRQLRVADQADLPLAFEPNAGQSDAAARFIVHASGGNLFFGASEVVLALGRPGSAKANGHPGGAGSTDAASPAVARLRFVGSNPSPAVAGGEHLPGKVNYFIGDDPSQWHTEIPTYSSIIYSGLYPGVDLTYEGTGGQLKATYSVAPGADPGRIRWRYEGAGRAARVVVDGGGRLHGRVPGLAAGQAVTVTEDMPACTGIPATSSKRPAAEARRPSGCRRSSTATTILSSSPTTLNSGSPPSSS